MYDFVCVFRRLYLQEESNKYLLFIGTCDTSPDVGTHILQFFWTSVFVPFSHPLAYFITKTAPTEDILLWFWIGVEYLQAAGFHVTGVIFDGSVQNRRFQVSIIRV